MRKRKWGPESGSRGNRKYTKEKTTAAQPSGALAGRNHAGNWWLSSDAWRRSSSARIGLANRIGKSIGWNSQGGGSWGVGFRRASLRHQGVAGQWCPLSAVGPLRMGIRLRVDALHVCEDRVQLRPNFAAGNRPEAAFGRREFMLRHLSVLISLAVATVAAAEEPVSFKRDIRPLCMPHCGACHGGVRHNRPAPVPRPSLAPAAAFPPHVSPSPPQQTPHPSC